MTTGLLWLDAGKGKSLEAKVSEAVSAYRAKPFFEDRAPDTCYVHPSTMSATTIAQVDGVRLMGMRAICPHNFYVVHVGGDGDGTAERRSPRADDGPRMAVRQPGLTGGEA